MKRLYLTVEGQTEQAFAVQVLQPHLANHQVFVTKPRLTGLVSRRRGRIPKGGLLRKFGHSLNDIRRWLQEDKSDDARFSMMVDLYSLPRDFPGSDEATGLSDPLKRATRLEAAIEEELGDHRFVGYISVHEFESLVLSDPSRFLNLFPRSDKEVAKLIGECRVYQTPEYINDGQHSHPKARIKKHLIDYDENVDGPSLAEAIGLQQIREKCAHFDRWLSRLESLDQ